MMVFFVYFLNSEVHPKENLIVKALVLVLTPPFLLNEMLLEASDWMVFLLPGLKLLRCPEINH